MSDGVGGPVRWRLTFDNEHQEDEFDVHPGEVQVLEARKAAPDAWTRVYRLDDGWRAVLVEEWPPLDESPQHSTRARLAARIRACHGDRQRELQIMEEFDV